MDNCYEAIEHDSRMKVLESPAFILRPKLFIDGDQWCALYGDNIQDGVCGFGSSPAKAFGNFDVNWATNLKKENR